MSQRAERAQAKDEELEKVLSKAFSDLSKKLTALILKREKKLLQALKGSGKPKKEESKKPRKGGKEKEVHRSKSSSEEDSDA